MRVAILTSDTREASKAYANPEPCMGLAPEALLQGFAKLPGVEIHVVSCLQQPVSVPEKLIGNIRYHFLHVPKIGWLRTFYQGCIRAVQRKLQEIQPDIVHGQGTERDCAISAAFSGFPNVITIHGNMRKIARANQAWPLSFYWLAARLENFVLPRTDGVVCITHYTEEMVRARARKTWIAPNAVDASFFDVEAAPDISAPPAGLCAGTICNYKNQNAFIRALDPLAKQKDFRIVFLGQVENGGYGREFLQLVRERPWCEHIGFVNREQLKARLKLATFLALPSLEDNCPMVVLEAMAAGLPVIANQVGGVPDLIEDGKTGLLCDPLNAASVGGAVGKILSQPQFARALAVEANRRARERFHPLVIARRHLEIYRELLNARSGEE